MQLTLTKVGKANGSVVIEHVKSIISEEIQEPTDSKVSVQDVTSALVNLGFDYNRSFAAASQVVKTSNTIEEAITEALRGINQ